MRRLSFLMAVLACGLLAAVAVAQSGTSAQAAGAPIFAPSLSPFTFDFVPVGTTSATRTETVTNLGTAALKLTAVEIGSRDAADFKIVSNSCLGATLAPRATCAVGIQFTPKAAGTRVAVLKFTDNSPCHDYVWMAGSGDDTKAVSFARTATCESSVDAALADAGTTVTNTSTSTVTNTTTTTTSTSPVSGSSIVLPKAATCASRRVVTIRFNAPRGKAFTSAKILLHGKTVKTLKGGDVKAKVSLKGLPRGRFTLQVRATTADGRHLTQTRHYVTCVASK